jgi:undecaprenyl pyrophosphate phosphatase UppP
MLGAGAFVAAIMGLLALFGLLKILKQGNLRLFGVWCLLFGGFTLIWQLQ